MPAKRNLLLLRPDNMKRFLGESLVKVKGLPNRTEATMAVRICWKVPLKELANTTAAMNETVQDRIGY